MHPKYKLGIVEYLNTKPLIYQIEKSNLIDKAEFIYAYPSLLSEYFNTEQIDIALLPIANIKLSNLTTYIVSNYCIGCNGEVASVGIVSDSPLSQIKEIFLDFQSTTSNELMKILIKDFWQKNIVYKNEGNFNWSSLQKFQGALVIGDKAFEAKKKYAYYYDLGSAWKEYTNLPFVFAAWISNKKIEEGFIKNFDLFQKKNLQRKEEIIKTLSYPHYDLSKYYSQNISYHLDEQKQKGLQLFLSMLN